MIQLTGILLLKIAGAIFAILLAINLLSHISSLHAGWFRWGDFFVVVLLGAAIFFNAGRIRSAAQIIPDTLGLFVIKSQQHVDAVKKEMSDTRGTITAMGSYFKDVARRELERRMRLETP